MARVKVKICCISSVAEAALACDAGADYLGLVGPMPTGPGVVTLDQAKQIASKGWPSLPVLLTASDNAASILKDVDHAGTSAVQLVRHVPAAVHVELALERPGLCRLQVLHVDPSTNWSRDEPLPVDIARLVDSYGDRPDYLLLDSGRPAVEELGGTGRTHDWRISAEIRARAGCPIFLAGGLTPENVAEAIETAQPFGVDLCSGVRTDGRLDPERLAAFIRGVRSTEVSSG